MLDLAPSQRPSRSASTTTLAAVTPCKFRALHLPSVITAVLSCCHTCGYALRWRVAPLGLRQPGPGPVRPAVRLGCPSLTATLLSFSPPPSIPLSRRRRTHTYASLDPFRLLASIACTKYPCPRYALAHAPAPVRIPCVMCSELPQVRGVCCLCVTLHCLYACRRFNLARLHLACISPGYARFSAAH